MQQSGVKEHLFTRLAVKGAGIAVLASLAILTGCDKINNANRTLDTMLGGDYEVHVQGFDKPFLVKSGKITSVPEKGYYVFYPAINGKKNLVQAPIQITTIIKTD